MNYFPAYTVDKRGKATIFSFQNNDCNFFERCVPNRDCQPGSMDCRLYSCVPERGKKTIIFKMHLSITLKCLPVSTNNQGVPKNI